MRLVSDIVASRIVFDRTDPHFSCPREPQDENHVELITDACG
jgi:hypothetical protein